MRNAIAVMLGLTAIGGAAMMPRRAQAKDAMAPAKGGAVYVCKPCKEFTTAAAAKKMHYKDSMGHKLTRMNHAPAGYKMMPPSTPMAGKMKSGKM